MCIKNWDGFMRHWSRSPAKLLINSTTIEPTIHILRYSPVHWHLKYYYKHIVIWKWYGKYVPFCFNTNIWRPFRTVKRLRRFDVIVCVDITWWPTGRSCPGTTMLMLFFMFRSANSCLSLLPFVSGCKS